jgi:plastocyanin
MKKPGKRLLYPVGVAVLALVLIPLGVAATSGSRAEAATPVAVKGREFSFTLSTKSLPKPGTAVFTFKNVGHVLHDFKINGKKTPAIQPGKTAKLVVAFKKKGKYAFLCTLPGHAAAGMKGVFTIK